MWKLARFSLPIPIPFSLEALNEAAEGKQLGFQCKLPAVALVPGSENWGCMSTLLMLKNLELSGEIRSCENCPCVRFVRTVSKTGSKLRLRTNHVRSNAAVDRSLWSQSYD